MFERIFNKFTTFADHHQVMFAIIIGFAFIITTWGVEKLLEHYFFPKRPQIGYFCAVVLGLITLWITQHFILHKF